MKWRAVLVAPLALLSSCGTHLQSTPAASGGYFRPLWTLSLPVNADSSPIYGVHVRGVSGGVVYVLAGNNGSNCNPGDPVRQATLLAVRAGSGKVLWRRSTSGPSRCTTAGPAVDPSGRWVYAPGLDGYVHRYDAATGAESKSGGWPERITLMPDVEKVAASPTIGGHYLYVTTSGFIGDAGHYQGHLVTIDLTTGRKAVFNSLCSPIHHLLSPQPGPHYCADERSGLFGRGQGAVDPVNGDVYVVSGNGAWNGRTNWGDSVLKLVPSGRRLLDTYTPTDQEYLNDSDLDLGSTGPALLPPITVGGRTEHLLAQAGKGPACQSCGPVVVRLLNRDNLSGAGGPGRLGGDLADVPTPGGCEVLTAPAVWTGGGTWVIYANSCGIAGYRLVVSGGKPTLQRAWQMSGGGTTPVVSGNVLYVASGGRVTAYRLTDRRRLGVASIGSVHWEYPLVAGHRLFVTDESGTLHAFRVG